MKSSWSFYKDEPSNIIWRADNGEDEIGPYYISFDKKTVYNFWSDWGKLTEEQKNIFRKEYPEMAELKG